MAVVFGSRGQSVAGDDKTMKTAREEEEGGADGSVFDMFSLMAQLPQKRKGLSRYFSGKSRSFTRVGEVKCAGDLEKLEIPEAKRGSTPAGTPKSLPSSPAHRLRPLPLRLRPRLHGGSR
ncbi:unnamed protein product [Spirodela intermedia]|uniref:Uncharacterized protein n=1 Tax=Spirodela intermedia TaxID=51605 RepID=A0A7I8IM31_SPIIN|nr:unnamed protein product [Spirodela intermedia]CAA6659007.1 unnamed protein product [Spirodela intermedia]